MVLNVYLAERLTVQWCHIIYSQNLTSIFQIAFELSAVLIIFNLQFNHCDQLYQMPWRSLCKQNVFHTHSPIHPLHMVTVGYKNIFTGTFYFSQDIISFVNIVMLLIVSYYLRKYTYYAYEIECLKMRKEASMNDDR